VLIFVEEGAAASVFIYPKTLPSGVKMIPDKAKLEVGDLSTKVKFSAASSATPGEYVIDWLLEKEDIESQVKFSAIKRTIFTVL
jgi:hypothetical protein